jgi:integrase
VEAYRGYLTEQGLSDKTIRVYVALLVRAGVWCRTHDTAIYTIGPVQVTALARDVVPFSSSSRRQLRSGLAHYWEMVGRPDPPLKAIRVPKKPEGRCRAVTPEQARDLVKVSIGWRPEGTAVLFGLYLALRASEIASARWDRLNGDGWYTVLGKGDRTHTLPVHPVLADELASQRKRHETYVFPGHRGRDHVTPATVWGWCKAVASEVGLGGLQTHQLRHTAIATVNDATGDLRAAQEFARHQRPETTVTYTRVTEKRLVDAVLSLDYLTGPTL